jgi:hypothetical protein
MHGINYLVNLKKPNARTIAPMRKLQLLFLLCITALSCTKAPEGETGSTATFAISGVHDVDLTQNSTASSKLPVSITSSTTETVSLRVDGLPRGVFADVRPSSGPAPFTASIVFWNDFSGTGGTYPVTVVGTSPSGTRSYPMNVTLDYYKGWQFGDSVYNQKGLVKDPGSVKQYPKITVFGGGAGQLTISFMQGTSLPIANKTYKISASSTTADEIQISMYDEPAIYTATGVGAPTGTFIFDTLGKFAFKCSKVEMSNGREKKLLSASFSE